MFAKNLKTLRTKKGFSLQDLSKKTKISASSLAKIEGGKSIPKIDLLISLCKVLDCSPDQLLTTSSISSSYDPITLKCAQIIHSMGITEKQWILLTLQGLKMKVDDLKAMDKLPASLLAELID